MLDARGVGRPEAMGRGSLCFFLVSMGERRGKGDLCVIAWACVMIHEGIGGLYYSLYILLSLL